MARRQTRRSVTVSPETYARLRSFCEVAGMSMSSVVEDAVRAVVVEPQHEDLIDGQLPDDTTSEVL